MFGWFKPTCPCDPAAKQWVETRLRWLTRQFGLGILLERPVILPTAEFFPDPWDGSPGAAQQMFRRVCGYMGANPNSVNLELFHDPTPRSMHQLDPSMGFAAGTWSGAEGSSHGGYGNDDSDDEFPYRAASRQKKATIRLEQGGLDRPGDLVGVMAHELAHQRLLGEGRFNQEAFDNELLTDLTAVYHGFGVFLANNPRKHAGKLSYWPGTKLRRPEYISEPMLGYALAHIAWFRDEERPAWARCLRWAPRAVFKQGLHYLFKTADSTFKPIRLRQPSTDED